MSVRLLLSAAERDLAAAGVASPRTDAELLLAHVLGVHRNRLLLVDDLDPVRREHYELLVGRRAAREPLQHLTGKAAFRGVELAVGPGVFVPRPETEVLAGWAVDVLCRLSSSPGRAPVAVDLCTGSGAIAAALVDEVPGLRMHAVELSPVAYGYAERNLAGTGVELHMEDIEHACSDLDGTVDVVVANPPYIPLDAFESVDVEARTHDPALALWSGADGLDAIRSVERVAARLLRAGGALGCEHADVQGHSVMQILTAAGRWADVRDHDDLADRPRFVTAVATGAADGWHDRRRE